MKNGKNPNLNESATLIVASYNGSKLIDIKFVPVSNDCEKTIASTGLTLTKANTIKAFLWRDVSAMMSLCESKSASYSNNIGE